MRYLLWKVAAVLLLACTANPVMTHAETFVIREGSIGFDPGDPASFVFRSDGLQLSGLFQPIATSGAFTCAPTACAPGTLVSLGTVFGGPLRDFNLGQGVATIDGVQHGSQTGPPGQGFLFLTGTLTFDAPDLPIPAGGDLVVRLTAPFLFNGRVIGSNERPVTMPLFEVDLVGAGAATMRLGLDSGLGLYRFEGLEYVFESSEPIPEPATLLLVGSGVAGLMARRKRLRVR